MAWALAVHRDQSICKFEEFLRFWMRSIALLIRSIIKFKALVPYNADLTKEKSKNNLLAVNKSTLARVHCITINYKQKSTTSRSLNCSKNWIDPSCRIKRKQKSQSKMHEMDIWCIQQKLTPKPSPYWPTPRHPYSKFTIHITEKSPQQQQIHTIDILSAT